MSNLQNLSRQLQQLPTLQEIHQERARRSFWAFCLYYDYDFFSKRPFLELVANVLQWVLIEYLQGRARKVGISMPPRAGKSYIVSMFCAWWLGKIPHHSVMRNTCTARLYQKFSYDVRVIVRSEKYTSVFPNIEMADDKQNLDGWNLKTATQVSYFGAGVGGTIIGFGANLAASDDLYRGLEDAMSVVYREKVSRWKESAHDSRKEKNCPEIYVGTRWVTDDEIGKVELVLDKYITIPALDADGNSFCEHVKTTQEYQDIKKSIDEAIWEAEYMQNPTDSTGYLFNNSDLHKFNPTDKAQKKAEFVFIPVDPADKGGDFYGAPLCEVIGDKVFINKVIFNKRDTDENIPDTANLAIENKAHAVQVESNGGWKLARKSLKKLLQDKLPECEVRSINARVNKETRILAAAAWIRNHCYFREDWETCGDQQYYDFMKNLTGYMREGKNKNDDAPDVLAQLYEYAEVNLSHLM